MTPDQLASHIKATPFTGRRRLIALAGPPASGKSTLAAHLAGADASFALVPMDGFHLDNSLLEPRGLVPRKGSPETFDVAGFVHLVRRLQSDEEVIYPLFDRSLDKSINAAGRLGTSTQTVIVEGNYLLLDHPGWRDLKSLWDYTVQLEVPLETLEARLIQRWLDHGLSKSDAIRRAQSNDLINARLLAEHSLPADLVIDSVSFQIPR